MKYIAVVLIVLLSGCSAFVKNEQVLRVQCNPVDATVFLDGKSFTCPQEIVVPRDKDIHIKISKDGYYPYETYTRKTLSGFGIGDIITSMFLIVPIIGLLSPGAYELTQTDFNIKLVSLPTLP